MTTDEEINIFVESKFPKEIRERFCFDDVKVFEGNPLPYLQPTTLVFGYPRSHNFYGFHIFRVRIINQNFIKAYQKMYMLLVKNKIIQKDNGKHRRQF